MAAAGATRADAAHGGSGPISAAPRTERARQVRADLALPLRAWATPGDWLLDNGTARAVVRARDGVLIDFWRLAPGSTTHRQLGSRQLLDGLTSVRPFLRAGQRELALGTSDVRSVDGMLETRREIELFGARLRLVTRFSLPSSEPRLSFVTRVEHLGGPELSGLALGERIRWGNSDYFIDGVRAAPSYSGPASSVGRKGAGGDLLLEGVGAPLQVRYQSTLPGLTGELVVEHPEFSLGAGQTARYARQLRYGALLDAAAPASSLSASLEVELRDEAGLPLAAKLSLRGLLGTADPDFGNDGDESGANRFVWSGNGVFRRTLPPGRYRVLATAGIERDAATWVVNVEPGKAVRLQGRLPRVITTPGWIAADLHLHQLASPDADIGDTTRVLSIAAEGLELAVASDHYTAGNLEPAVRDLRQTGALASELRVWPGTELTTLNPDFGHFNVFPLSDASGIAYENTTARQMFAAVRQASPEALLQVNHPRWPGGGYFNRYALDTATGQVPAALREAYSPDFDVVEVFNGFDAWSRPIVRNVLLDYMRLLGRGRHYTATGNSDSHGLFFVDPGLPRNLIQYGPATTDADDLDASPAAVLAALRAGHVVVTNGPMLEATLDGVGPGGRVKTGGRSVRLAIRVRAAPWIDVRQVEVLRGARGERIRSLPVAPAQEVIRFDYASSLPGNAATFIVVVASGDAALPNVHRAGVRPFAFTNPIYIEP